MDKIRRVCRPVSLVLAMVMVMLSGPYQYTMAAMVQTESVVSMAQGNDARQYVNSVLARQDVQAAFTEQGIDPLEAQERINSLSDAELVSLADKLANMPAGGDIGIVSALLIIFLVIVILKVL